ncbi:pyridoxamine 5'-phosphate oxidase family protein [Micromonospora soli]|uniref:pyridoxamine 5'-phosphate oxidase family protein n=1 Tax=Micromonospora sp. NBRC 110009 TaxID=3061627 RepID=UPI0026711CCE|nr:pyridoxamine 5'-phosphate oxidase family protein [Micromonospora sp. NBRC 110009]WKU01094.1 pyridoxamine 5'-phosphate oxidase family protein [Micromonospora sp. NBRC 110009]
MTPPPRSLEQRWTDTRHRLEHDVDVWVATADPADATPYLVPLSFLWDGETLLLSTAEHSPTGRNLRDTGRVRLGIGPTRDVVMVEGTVEMLRAEELPDGVGDAFAAKTGFDPRRSRYPYFRVRPERIQAWREVNEIADRDLLRNGQRVTEAG